jgi:purine-cytosine permease-like protein
VFGITLGTCWIIPTQGQRIACGTSRGFSDGTAAFVLPRQAPRRPETRSASHVDERAGGSHERNLKEWDFFLLWAGAAISLSEIWAGGLLVSFGLLAGLGIILLGHLLGNTPMALGGLIGSRHGVPSIVGTRGALGNRGSALPAVLNVVQLVGWTAVMLWIGGQAAAGLAGGAETRPGWIVALGC